MRIDACKSKEEKQHAKHIIHVSTTQKHSGNWNIKQVGCFFLFFSKGGGYFLVFFLPKFNICFFFVMHEILFCMVKLVQINVFNKFNIEAFLELIYFKPK